MFHVTMSGIETPAQRSSHCSEAQPDTKRQRIDQPNSAPVLTDRSILRQSAAAATTHGCAARTAQTAPEQQDEGCTTSRAVIPASEAQHAACQAGDSACQSPAPAQHDAGNSPAAAQPQQAQHSGSTAARADSQAPVPELPAHEGGIGELAADDSLAQRQPDGAGPAAAQQARRRLRSFYGSSGQTAVELRIQRFLQGVKLRLRPRAPYKVFPHQAAAFEFADAHSDEHDLRIFSFEQGVKGTRQFMATTYDEFWARYRAVDLRRHHYEIIRELRPCNLYFDLEFCSDVNAGADGDALVDSLLADVAGALARHFEISLPPECVLELDSSTPAKFSRHIIVRLPGAAFETNRDAGAFVGQLLGSDAQNGPLGVAKDAAGARTCFVDTSVYSRNRAFRLYLSSKAGKKAVLQPTGRLAPTAASQKDTFMQSLICNVPPGCRLLRCGGFGGAPAWQSVKPPSGRGQSPAAGSPAHRPPSPFPSVDAFLARVCTQGGSQGYVRTWTAVDSSVILYGIGGNRWCGNIGRQHKSNGVYIVVDLAGGQFWQKCFDTDCRAYRSVAAPLPPELAAKVVLPPPRESACGRRPSEGVLAGEEAAEGSDAALAAAADELEADHTCLQALMQWEQSQQGQQQADARG